jgi:hypothetical protein
MFERPYLSFPIVSEASMPQATHLGSCVWQRCTAGPSASLPRHAGAGGMTKGRVTFTSATVTKGRREPQVIREIESSDPLRLAPEAAV